MRGYGRAHLFWCSVLIFDHANPMIFIFCGPFKAGCVFARTGASARIKLPCPVKVGRSTRCASVGGGGILSAFVRSSCTPEHVYLGLCSTSARFWLSARWRRCRALLSALLPAGSGAGCLAACAFFSARRRRFLGGFMRCAARVKHQSNTPTASVRRVHKRRTSDTASRRGVCTPWVPYSASQASVQAQMRPRAACPNDAPATPPPRAASARRAWESCCVSSGYSEVRFGGLFMRAVLNAANSKTVVSRTSRVTCNKRSPASQLHHRRPAPRPGLRTAAPRAPPRPRAHSPRAASSSTRPPCTWQ